MKDERMVLKVKVTVSASDLFFVAAASGNLTQIEECLKMTPPDGIVNNDGRTPLHVAIQHNRREAIGLLCARGADLKTCVWHIEAKDYTETNGLGIALQFSNVETISLLLNLPHAEELGIVAQVLLNLAKNKPEQSVLIFKKFFQDSGIDLSRLARECVKYNNRALFEELVSRKVFLTDILLHEAVCGGHESFFDRLVELGLNPNPIVKKDKSFERWNFLFALTLPSSKFLSPHDNGIPKKFHLNCPHDSKKHYLNEPHWRTIVTRITPSHINIARKLLDFGVDINAIRTVEAYSVQFSKYDYSVLSQAVRQQKNLGSDLLVKFLLERGADHRRKLKHSKNIYGGDFFYAGLGEYTLGQDQEAAIAEFETRYAEHIEKGKLLLEASHASSKPACRMS